jgi:hypothetical protein
MFNGLGPHTCRNREFAGREFESPAAPCAGPSKSRTPMVKGQRSFLSETSLSGNQRMWCRAFHATQNLEYRTPSTCHLSPTMSWVPTLPRPLQDFADRESKMQFLWCRKPRNAELTLWRHVYSINAYGTRAATSPSGIRESRIHDSSGSRY